VLKLSSDVSDVFPKVLKLSSEVSECKPLVSGMPACVGLLALVRKEQEEARLSSHSLRSYCTCTHVCLIGVPFLAQPPASTAVGASMAPLAVIPTDYDVQS